MLQELLRAFLFIFLAEMGDKTQILAMSFATKYKIKFVILGVLIGSFANHALAVLLGANLQAFIPINTLSIVAGFSFILFGVWSFEYNDEEVENKMSKYGPIITVSLAFFIGELGDKTQLTATVLSTDATYPFFILMGTVSGMVFTSLIGIFIGIKIGNKIDEFYIKLFSGFVFIFFGYLKLAETLPSSVLTVPNILLFSIFILFMSGVLIRKGYSVHQTQTTRFQFYAQRLQDFYNNLYKDIESICLGENHCGTCGGNKCLVGYTKNIIKAARNNQTTDITFITENVLKKDFDRKKVLESLIQVIKFLSEDWNNEQNNDVQKVRRNLEYILYQTEVEATSFEEYIEAILTIDHNLHNIIKKEQ